MAEYSCPRGWREQSSKVGTSWHLVLLPSCLGEPCLLPAAAPCLHSSHSYRWTPRQERETEGGSVEMSGGAGEAGSQEGACVDTVNHTEAEMPPAQVPSAQFTSTLYFSVTHSCLN